MSEGRPASSVARTPGAVARWLVATRLRWIVTGIGLAAIGLVHVVIIPTNADVAWLLFTARRVMEGATLYVDLIEVNPPLIVWLNLPPVALAELLEVPSRPVFFLYVAAWVLLSLRLSWNVLGALTPEISTRRRRAYLLLLVVGFVTAVGYVYGQREHFMVLFVVPYALAIAARATGGVPVRDTLVAIGVLGGLGFMIKPYYVLAWLGLEGFYWVRHRQSEEVSATALRTALDRPELIAAILVACLYGTAVLVLTPEYLEMGALLAPVYVGVPDTSFGALVTHRVTLVGAFTLVALSLSRLRIPEATVAGVFGVLLFFWLVGAIAQVKGWWYHYYPALAASFVLLGLLVAVPSRHPGKPKFSFTVPRVLAMLILVAAFVGRVAEAVNGLRWRADFDRQLPVTTQFVREHAGQDGNLAVLSPQLHAAFPLVNRADVRWTLRFNAMWVPPVVYSKSAEGGTDLRYNWPGEMEPPERYFYESTLADLAADPPEVLLIDHDRVEPPGFDYMEYFGRDPRFRRLMDQCAFAREIGRYRAFRCGSASDSTGLRPLN